MIERDDPDWLTLKEAEAATGIPVPTLRKWARHDNVPSYLQDTPMGQLRMVSLRAIHERASLLGRAVTGNATVPPADKGRHEAPKPPRREDEVSHEPEIPPGTMLVPIDAWDKMLMQLGNLHEAGQQLADARERAAKAETEASFLRERLGELRTELADARARPAPPPPIVEEPSRVEHFPISDASDTAAQSHPENADPGSAIEIDVRHLGESPAEPEDQEADGEEVLSLTAYSLAMAKHLFTTWRGRPRR